MHAFVTGAAGFIGSNLVDELLHRGHKVTGFDNLSTGREEFITSARTNTSFRLYQGDLLDTAALQDAMQGADAVFHLAANADVRFGTDHPRRDLEQNTIATANVLEAMRLARVPAIAFASTGSVYGEAKVIPTPEDAPFPIQTSLYSASKLAAEGMIAAYAEGFGIRAVIFRFVSILGERYTHGHVFDFCKRLLQDPTKLNVLGDGTARKSYLYVGDCISGVLHAFEHAPNKVNIYNLGTNEYCQVRDSIGWICGHLDVAPELIYAGGDRGWIGDNPFIFLETQRIRDLGWSPRLTIRDGVLRTVDFLKANPWVFARD